MFSSGLKDRYLIFISWQTSGNQQLKTSRYSCLSGLLLAELFYYNAQHTDSKLYVVLVIQLSFLLESFDMCA